MVSSNAYMWFGIPGQSMQWVPAPKAGFQRNWKGNVDTIALEDGRQVIQSSVQRHQQFTGDFFGDYSDPSGVNIDVFNQFAAGFYGNGPIAFANPYDFQRNLFAPHWASPALVEQGWAPPTSINPIAPPTFGPITGTHPDGRPNRYAQYNITTTAYAAASSANQYNQYIAIPPGYQLSIGASGVASGAGAIVVQPFFAADNSTDAVSVLNLIDYNSNTHMNATYSGSTYNAVRVFLSRTSEVNSAIVLYSMMAQLTPIGIPASPLSHIPGQGNLGLRIVGDAIAETYNYGGIQKGLNLTLEEVV